MLKISLPWFPVPIHNSYNGHLRKRTLGLVLWGVMLTSIILGINNVMLRDWPAALLMFSLSLLCVFGLEANEHGSYLLVSGLTTVVILAVAFYTHPQRRRDSRPKCHRLSDHHFPRQPAVRQTRCAHPVPGMCRFVDLHRAARTQGNSWSHPTAPPSMTFSSRWSCWRQRPSWCGSPWRMSRSASNAPRRPRSS